MKRLAIAVLLVCAFSAAQAGSLEDGMHHLNNKAYASALAAFRLAAARGSAAAERQIGFMYYQGLGLKQSNTDAVAWFERAANDGDLQSQINLGQMYENGMSVVQSDTRAAHWYGLAAMQGDRRSQLRYGEILFLGAGVARDKAEAVKWWRVAMRPADETTTQMASMIASTLSTIPREIQLEGEQRAAAWIAANGPR